LFNQEYDYYLRPQPDKKLFRLCHFKGGGSTTTETKVKIAEMTPEEQQLWGSLMPYLDNGIQRAGNVGNMFDQYLADDKLYLPNFGELYNQSIAQRENAQNTWTKYMQSALADYEKSRQAAHDTYYNLADQNIANAERQRTQIIDEGNKFRNSVLGELDKRQKDYANWAIDRNQNNGDWYANRVNGIADALREKNDILQSQKNEHLNPILEKYNQSMDSLSPKIDQLAQKVADNANSIASGNLPESINNARVRALQDDASKLLGAHLANASRNGTLSSSVANRGLYDIQNSITDSLAERYTNDLATYSNLTNTGATGAANALASLSDIYANQLNNNRSVYEKDYETSLGLEQNIANALFNATTNTYNTNNSFDTHLYDSMQDLTQRLADSYLSNSQYNENNRLTANNLSESNRGNLYAAALSNANNMAESIYGNNSTFANQWNANENNVATKRLEDALNAASGSWSALFNLANLYDQLMAPALNTANSWYANRHGVQNVTQTTTQNRDSSSDIWGAVGGIGTALIACFTPGSLVFTPSGRVPIEKLNVGDTVYSIDDKNNLVTETITRTTHTILQDRIDVHLDNGVILHTTPHQPLIEADTQLPILPQDADDIPILTREGTALVYRITNPPPTEVYDIHTTGRNIFFVDSIAVEGY
jgi:hypothetical protein